VNYTRRSLAAFLQRRRGKKLPFPTLSCVECRGVWPDLPRINGGDSIAGLHLQSPRHYIWQPSLQVSQTLRPSYLNHMIATATQADQHTQPHHSDCRTALTHAHTNSRTLPTFDISPGSLTFPSSEAVDFVELILLYSEKEGAVWSVSNYVFCVKEDYTVSTSPTMRPWEKVPWMTSISSPYNCYIFACSLLLCCSLAF
jgi:hypothetical protein